MSIVRSVSRWLVLASLSSIISGADVSAQRRMPPGARAAARPSKAFMSEEVKAVPPPNSSGARAFSISGRVVDAHGAPIADAEVWVEDMGSDDGRSVWLGTDADGRFGSPRIPSGLHTVTATARGFVARAVAVEVTADLADLTVVLALAPSPRVLVVDPEGRPVPGAVVVACSETSEVTLHSMADGTATFGPGAIGCAARAHHARFSHSAPVRLGGQRVTTLRLELGGAIEGVVTDPGGSALFDGEISVSSFEPGENEQPLNGSSPELTLPLGREFRFSGLAPGVYALSVVRRLRIAGCSARELLASTSFEVAGGRVVRGVHVVTDPSAGVPSEVLCPTPEIDEG
ncbi:MAG TPA: carboxypeptidase-like regulatory domain-containing protein [Polyangiaceae bacterium]